MIRRKQLLLQTVLLPALLLSCFCMADDASDILKESQRSFQYQSAAEYTHVRWNNSQAKHLIELMPLQNFTGVDIGSGNESWDYYEHGKIPAGSNNILNALMLASRKFVVDRRSPDYKVQFTIEDYALPYPYSPDDNLWQKASDNLDRAFQSPEPATVKLTIQIESANRTLKRWQDSVEMTISQCDLNASPQPLNSQLIDRELTSSYFQSTTGQSFLAAANFLISKAINRLDQESRLATLDRKHGSELWLRSDASPFTIGEKLDIFQQSPSGKLSSIPAGKIQIIKSYGEKALAYPITVRADLLKSGDKIALSQKPQAEKLKFKFIPTGQCAPVTVASAN